MPSATASGGFPPDLSTLTTSSQIFSQSAGYTLPQIRTLHKTLHDAIDDKAARLRTQVGGSYRELLGTADTIVQMKTDMENVTSTLWRMGQRCGRGVVGSKVEALGGFLSQREDETDGKGQGKGLSREARRRLLGACVLSGGRVLTNNKTGTGNGTELAKGDRLIVAAKICVLGRLLVKSLSTANNNTPNSSEQKEIKRFERQLESLRHRLLVRIKNTLANIPPSLLSTTETTEKATRHQQENVLKALVAYSLPTSSGAQDVLRHFLRVRSEAMVLSTEGPEENITKLDPHNILYCLGLYTKTLQDVQALFPNKLPDGLAALKKDRLLADSSLRCTEGLRLDTYERFCGDEIRYFKPFIRHDDLDVKQAKEMWGNWATDGGEVFLRGLERTLEGMSEFKAIVDLRTSVLKLWISEGGKIRGFDSSVMLDRIRGVIKKTMLTVLQEKISKLRLVGREASAAINSWRGGVSNHHLSLWEEGSFDMDLSTGAGQFTQDVVARLYGRNDAVSRAVSGYMSWFRIIDDVKAVVDTLKRQRWDNDVEEIEDEETIETRQQLLAREDPVTLSKHLNESLVRAFRDLDGDLGLLWGAIAEEEDTNRAAQISMYILRLVRDIRGRLPEGLEEVKGFGLTAVPALHRALAESVVVSPMEELVGMLGRRTVVGRSLWEEGHGGGMPDLPSSPSPGVFRFLRSLSLAMADAGADLWSAAAVGVLKDILGGRVCGLWGEALWDVVKAGEEEKVDGSEKGENEDEEEEEEEKKEPSDEVVEKKNDGPTPEQRRDLLVQWLFDLLYLGHFIELPRGDLDDGQLKKLEEKVYEASGLDNPQARERLVKSSQEYFKRTSLLFGLLS
ncbi:putative sphingolipid c9-methyltransferase [Rhypophila sp. PSN 637]